MTDHPRPRVARVRRVLQAPADEVWELLTDVRRHAAWIPFTRMEAAPRLAVGDTFRAVTGPLATRTPPVGGRLGLLLHRLVLPDTMRVDALRPPSSAAPGHVRYRKLGPVLLGTAELHVRAAGPSSSEVVWTEDVHLARLPRRLTAPLLRPLLTLMLRSALGRAAREVSGALHRRR